MSEVTGISADSATAASDVSDQSSANADSPSNQAVSSSLTAGALLRQARQAKGLHIAALAVSLKVPQRKLEALEADRYGELPDATFVRALAQTVCRALKVDRAPILALLPLYGLRGGLEESGALVLLTVLISGTVVMQLPIGWLADKLGRHRLLIVCAIVGAAIPLLVPMAMGNDKLLWPALFLWGGTTVSLYTIGLAMLGERFGPDLLPAANSMMVISYCVGSIVGPPLTGMAMETWGMDSMPYGLALVCGLFALGAVAGRIRSARG